MRFILFFFMGLLTIDAQSVNSISIVSKEDNSTIANARIISGSQVFYTNDDGKASIPVTLNSVEISAPSYEGLFIERIDTSTKVISLNPLYKNIEEIKLSNIDTKKIIQNTLNNYLDLYYTKPSLYRGTIKQKGYIDNSLVNIFVADIDIWSLYNFFNYKEKNNADSFVQIGLKDVKYYKTKKLNDDYPFNTDVQIVPKDFVQKLFLNSELIGILNDTRDIQLYTKVLYENQNVQYLQFSGKKERVEYKGMMIYNKSDNLISYIDVGVDNYLSKRESKNKKGEEYEVITNAFNISYDFYKRNGKYIPSLIKTKASGYSNFKGKSIPFNFKQEIKLGVFYEADKRGLKNKIDLNKGLTDNITSKDITESGFLLSKEEQKFINEH